MRTPFLLLLLSLVLFTGGCARSVQQAAYLPAAQIPQDAAPAPIMFRGVELLLPVGANVGFEKEGKYCSWPRYPVSRTALKDIIDKDFIKQTFHDALEGQGYDVTGRLDLAYDLEDEQDRAEYSVTAKVRTIDLETCDKPKNVTLLFFAERPGIVGEVYMQVEWTVYDALHRRVAYKTTTEGYTKRKEPNAEGLTLMFTDAFAMAAHNLGADSAFENLLIRGIAPAKQDAPAKPERPRRFDPNEKITLPPHPLSRTALTKSVEQSRSAALTVQKFGHASGVFLTPQGHILTTASAVGDGLRTRIITDDGTALTAEILRRDKIRNVALLKLEELPDNLKITTLPLRPEPPAVGEHIYMFGTPGSISKTKNSLTSGMVSALRENIRHNGVRQDFIQADITTGKGSEGGALLDENGNIIGLADGGQDTGGLHYFIPMAQALAALDIAL